ncbi:hypothetical protein P152DRAFT_450828 [Eremomyces bilateralis CBS 781.70]|uniref:Cora-domain-containing protein n=1 Tax=Eremomyces bilateralis CBS 781.70 TaxID=1392243 RepID=A0A6G1FYR1_9PEZI|nr:uncharacterized protein P152DRAFT_450828 [Eremomyces bilateralis CBS 781.70]KAF1810841.1 hypothetical protein P152DRAFT_450828 [Eremomyces bilateralis CBS 781.70]
MESPRRLEEANNSENRTLSAASRQSRAATEGAVSSLTATRSVASPNKKGPTVVEVGIHPHVGDPYFTGTIYHEEPWLAKDKAQWYTTSRPSAEPYFNHVKSVSDQFPRLRYLAEFMEASTVPKKSASLPPLEIMERQSRVKVAHIDFTAPNRMVQHALESREQLASLLQTSIQPTTSKRNCLFIVEDLSQAVIELFGTAFDIDPTFFRGHLEDHTWFNIKDDWVEMPELESQARQRSFVNLRYMQPRFFDNPDESQRAKEQAGEWNILRRIDLEAQVRSGAKAWWEPSPHQVGLLRRKISIWSREDKSGWTGIILVDPSLTEGYPLWKGYGRFDSPPRMNEKSNGIILPNNPLFDNLMSSVTSLTPEDATRLSSDPEYITSKIYPFIFAEILVTLQYTFTGLFQIEWVLDSERRHSPEDLDRALDNLHKWQRRLPFYSSWIKDSISNLRGRYAVQSDTSIETSVPQPSSAPPLNWQSDIIRDYHSLLDHLNTLQHRTEKIMSMATAIISVEESKKAMVESRNMSRITYLAFVFVPWSFVTGFLSMSDEINHRSAMVYGVFFVTAVPLSILAVVLAAYWEQIMRWWETRKLNQKGKKSKG